MSELTIFLDQMVDAGGNGGDRCSSLDAIFLWGIKPLVDLKKHMFFCANAYVWCGLFVPFFLDVADSVSILAPISTERVEAALPVLRPPLWPVFLCS